MIEYEGPSKKDANFTKCCLWCIFEYADFYLLEAENGATTMRLKLRKNESHRVVICYNNSA